MIATIDSNIYKLILCIYQKQKKNQKETAKSQEEVQFYTDLKITIAE